MYFMTTRASSRLWFTVVRRSGVVNHPCRPRWNIHPQNRFSTTPTNNTGASSSSNVGSGTSQPVGGKIPAAPTTKPEGAAPTLPRGSVAETSSPSPPPNALHVTPPPSVPSTRFAMDYSSMRGPVSWLSLFLAAVVSATLVSYYKIERERRLEDAMGKIVSSESDGWTPDPILYAKRKFIPTKYGWFPVVDSFDASGKPAIGGPWSLVDLDGNLVTNKSFEGKWLLLYFGFARCPDICPSEMVKVGKIMDTLKQDHPNLYKQIVPVFVSIDPARDSLQALREYAKDFHPDYVFLTGSPVQVQRMAKLYRVYVSKADETDDGDYLVDHSIVIYFHEDTGELSDCFTQSMRASDIVEKVVSRMKAINAVM